jgi:hypothetical protein
MIASIFFTWDSPGTSAVDGLTLRPTVRLSAFGPPNPKARTAIAVPSKHANLSLEFQPRI